MKMSRRNGELRLLRNQLADARFDIRRLEAERDRLAQRVEDLEHLLMQDTIPESYINCPEERDRLREAGRKFLADLRSNGGMPGAMARFEAAISQPPNEQEEK